MSISRTFPASFSAPSSDKNGLPHKAYEAFILNRTNLKRYISRLFILSALVILVPHGASAEDLALINRPVNISGFTGLLYTTAPYTLSSGTVEIGASVVSENSTVPDFTITEYPMSISVGMPHNTELVIRDSYYEIKEGPTGTAVTERDPGDLSVSVKWNFLPPSETSIRPALAVFAGGLFSTDSRLDKKVNSVRHWGAFLGFVSRHRDKLAGSCTRNLR